MRFIIIVVIAFLPSVISQAGFVKNIVGKSENWTVLKANPNGNDVCYAMLYTHNRRGNQKKQQEKPYIMVHYFSENKIRFSAYFGYNLIEGQPVNLSIDSTQYKISSVNEYAIAETATQDEEIISRLKTGNTLLIRGEGIDYSYSVDTYLLKGFAKAFKIMQKKCDSNANNSAFKTIVPERESLKKLQSN